MRFIEKITFETTSQNTRTETIFCLKTEDNNYLTDTQIQHIYIGIYEYNGYMYFAKRTYHNKETTYGMSSKLQFA